MSLKIQSWFEYREATHLRNILTYDDEELQDRGRKRVRDSVRLHDFDDKEDEEE